MISYQHIFWFYSHPAVYIMMLPGFGIISEVISTHARKPIFGYRLMALALIGIVVLSYTVWAHHMFVSRDVQLAAGADDDHHALDRGARPGSRSSPGWGPCSPAKLHLRSTAMLFALAFIVTFTMGGISGVMLGMVPIDIHVSDTYFIVAHIHFVLFGGSVFTIFAGIYHWFPKMTGRMYDEKLGRVHFWLTLVGMYGTFLPMHWIGMEGMPRRVADYSAQFGDWNLLISLLRLPARRRPAGLPLQHDRQLEVGAAGRRQPVAREDDRVAGLLAAADLQLRRDPPRGRRALRVRRARRPPRDHRPGGGRGRGRGARGGRNGGSAERREPGADPASRTRQRRRLLAAAMLAFLNEVAGGRKLLEATRERRRGGRRGVAVVAPQNQPAAGQIVDRDEVREAALSRVEVTQAVLADFGIEAAAAVMDPDPALALDDADPRLRAPARSCSRASTRPASG